MPESDEADDVRLSQPVATPRVLPVDSDGITAEELFGAGSAPASDITKPMLSEPKAPAGPATVVAVCPLCATRLDVPADQVGKRERCPDCHTEFVVPPPKRPPLRSRPAAVDDGDELRLGETFERPKYEPLTRGVVRRDELDAIEDGQHGSSHPSRTAPIRDAQRRTQDEEFVFPCRVCGTQLWARPSQVGRRARCGDCGSVVEVPTPPARRRHREAAVSLDVGLDVPLAPVTEPPRATVAGAAATPAVQARHVSPLDDEAREALERAEATARKPRSDPEQRQIDKLPYWPRLLSVFASPGVLGRGLLIAMGVLFNTTLLAYALGQDSEGASRLVMVIIKPVLAIVTLPTLLFWSATAITIVEDTANGLYRVAGWADDMFMDLFSQLLVACVTVVVSMLPGMVPAMAGVSFNFPIWWPLACLFVSFCLFFPIVLLSVLEGGHLSNLVSAAVIASLVRVPTAWLRFSLESLVLLGAIFGLAQFAVSQNLGLRCLVAVGIVLGSFLYCRAVGLLAWSASVGAEKSTEADEESLDQDAPRGEARDSEPASR